MAAIEQPPEAFIADDGATQVVLVLLRALPPVTLPVGSASSAATSSSEVGPKSLYQYRIDNRPDIATQTKSSTQSCSSRADSDAVTEYYACRATLAQRTCGCSSPQRLLAASAGSA